MKQTEFPFQEMPSLPASSSTPGERLRFLRKQLLHMNQRDFALQTGISISTYTKIESDKLKISRGTLQKLEQAFCVSQDWILHGAGDLPQNLEVIIASKQPQTRRPVGRHEMSDEELELVISLAMDPELQSLAAQLSETLSTSHVQAMAEIIIGKLKTSMKGAARN